MPFLKRHWPWIILLLAPLLAIGKAVFTSNCIGAFDQIHAMAPWFGPAPNQPWDVLQADSVLQFYPWRMLVFESWANGSIPSWNPYALGGTPLLANSQSGALYPLHILVGLLRLPVETGIDLLAWFHLFWGGLGVCTLVRKLGGNSVGGAAAGISFQLSPFMLSWAALPSVITTVSWIPWLICGVAMALRVVDDEGIKNSWRGYGLITLAAAMLVLAGHLQFAFYGFLAGGVCFILWSIFPPPTDAKRNRVLTLVLAVLSLVAGVFLAGPHIVPSLVYSADSHRRTSAPTEEGYAAYNGLALQLYDVLGRLVNTNAHGKPTEFYGPEVVPQYWPTVAKPGANFAESAATLGAFVLAGLALLLGSGVTRRTAIPVGIVGVIALLMALGTPVNRLFYMYFPGFSATGSPGRATCLVIIAASVLAGIAVSRLAEGHRPKWPALSLAVYGVLAVIGLMAVVSEPPDGFDPVQWKEYAHAAHKIALPATLISIVLGSALFVSLHEKGKKWFPAVAVALPLVTWLLAGNVLEVRTGDPSFLATAPARIGDDVRIAVVNERWTFVGVPPAILPPNTGTAAHVRDIGGYDSLLSRDSVQMLHEIDGKDSAPEANGNMMFVKPSFDAAKLGEAGVTRLLRIGPDGKSISEEMIAGPGIASLDGSPMKITKHFPGDITVTFNGSGRLVVRERAMKGWTATLDGNAKSLENSRWLELNIPESGSHTVRFRYEVPGFQGGLLLAIVGLVLTALTAVATRFVKSV